MKLDVARMGGGFARRFGLALGMAFGLVWCVGAGALAEPEPAGDIDQPIGQPIVDDAGQLVFPGDAAIPKFMTPIEQQFMAQYLQSLRPAGGVALDGSNCCSNNGTPGCDDSACQGIVCSVDPFCCNNNWDQLCANQAGEFCQVCGGGPPEGTAPPTGPVVAPPEYAPTEAIFIAWKGNTSWKNILASMGSQITTAGDADLVVYADNQTERNAAFNALSATGASMSRVVFKIKPMDSIWMRDYGPRFVYEGGVRVVTDHTYNRPRPLDNATPSHYASTEGFPYYKLPILHGGGNYHLHSNAEGYATDLIVNENAFFSPAQVFDLILGFWGLSTNYFDAFPTNVDATQHIDMWMIPVSPTTVIVSDWPAQSGTIQDQISDAAAAWFAAEGFTVFRTPARTVSGTHYTYTNAVICNDIVLVPTYTATGVSQYNAEALSVWQQALPGKTIVPINAQGIVTAAGVLHCIVKHKPASSGGENPVVYLRNQLDGATLDPGSVLTLQWISDDDQGVVGIDLQLSTNAGGSFEPIALAINDTGNYDWTIPDVATAEAIIRITARDQPGNTGSFDSVFFAIDGTIIPNCPGDINDDGVVDSSDLGILLNAFGNAVAPGAGADFNGDGIVDASDLGILLNAFGASGC